MKFIKNHLMFILPLMAILLGIEFYLIFERSTDTYETKLTQGYTMLVVSKSPVQLDTFQNLNTHISSSSEVNRDEIISNIAKGMSQDSSNSILAKLPYFYNLGLNLYLNSDELEQIKSDLKADSNIKRVETFGTSHASKYKLFAFIKFTLETFIIFMMVVSFILIVKQMEIWKYQHKERMQIMEIFGAPLMLRAGVLFRIAFLDAIFSTLFISILFMYIKFSWAMDSGIDLMIEHQEALFHASDILILLCASLLLVVIAVYFVVFSSKGVKE
ncbi:MAG: cell division protein FtsX [Sulfurovum sp.]|nr:cell division protein FtsX [Sulfurovum sp.]